LEFFHQSIESLNSIGGKISGSWDQIQQNLTESNNILRHVAGSLSSVLNSVKKKIEENEDLMRHMLIRQMELGELPSIPDDLNLPDEELRNLALELEATTLR
jgi:hypothetical protein